MIGSLYISDDELYCTIESVVYGVVPLMVKSLQSIDGNNLFLANKYDCGNVVGYSDGFVEILLISLDKNNRVIYTVRETESREVFNVRERDLGW